MKETKLSNGAVKFVEIDPGERYQEPLVMAVYGPGGSGKSRFGITAPGPVGVIPLGRKARMTAIKTAEEFGRRVIIPEEDFVRTKHPRIIASLVESCGKEVKVPLDGLQPKCCTIHYYRWHVNKVRSAIFTLAELPEEQCKSIVIDDATLLYEDLLFANHGRAAQILAKGPEKMTRAIDNREMVEIIAACGHKNLILVYKCKDEFVNDKRTGKQTWDGFGKLRFEVNTMVETFGPQEKQEDGEPNYRMVVRQCQANPELQDVLELSDESITFADLATSIYPLSDRSEWE